MHNKAYITFEKGRADTSEKARQYTFDTLEEEGFATQTRFFSGPSEGFIIGGRFTGDLQVQLARREFFTLAEKLVHAKPVPGLTDTEAGIHAKQLDRLWRELGMKGENPYARDLFRTLGYEDDAMLVSRKLYNKVLKPYECKNEHEGEFWDLDGDLVSKWFINKKWIVVIVYHS